MNTNEAPLSFQRLINGKVRPVWRPNRNDRISLSVLWSFFFLAFLSFFSSYLLSLNLFFPRLFEMSFLREKPRPHARTLFFLWVCVACKFFLSIFHYLSLVLLYLCAALRSIHHKRIRFSHWPSAVRVIRLDGRIRKKKKQGVSNEEKQKDNHSWRKELERGKKTCQFALIARWFVSRWDRSSSPSISLYFIFIPFQTRTLELFSTPFRSRRLFFYDKR